MIYNYEDCIIEDILCYISEDYGMTLEQFIEKFKEESFDKLYNECMDCDSITGNMSGSYTYNAKKAHENLFGNEYYLECFKNSYGISEEKTYDWEYLDVGVRCYLLPIVIAKLIEKVQKS